MRSEFEIIYDVFNPLTGKTFYTESRVEALSYFEEHYTIYERHVSTCRPSEFVSTLQEITIMWNDDPNFLEKLYENLYE
jgi:hypothetical protein